MGSGYASTIAALAGTVIGGLTTLLTTWLTHTAQVRAARLTAERTRREDLYGRIMEEIALLYSLALTEEGLSYAKMVNVIALRGRIMLFASSPVVESVNRALGLLMDLQMGPQRSPSDVRRMMEDGSLNAIPKFAEACRKELGELGLI